jgi:DNA-binding transcriptional LysR family regulator
MASINAYVACVAVVECGSLTGAARRLGRSLQAVSRLLADLEQELGVQLIARTTRSCRPTAAGERFHARIKTVLADLDLARNEVAASAVEIDGSLRIGAPSQFGVRYLVPAIAAFMARYPALNVELVLSDQLVDPQAAGLDLVLRFGQPADSALRQHRLGTVRRVIYGAPGYFAQHGRPLHPRDLRRHECIVRSGVRGAETWRFHGRQGALAVGIKGRFRSDSIAACCEAAIQGMGIGRGLLY